MWHETPKLKTLVSVHLQQRECQTCPNYLLVWMGAYLDNPEHAHLLGPGIVSGNGSLADGFLHLCVTVGPQVRQRLRSGIAMALAGIAEAVEEYRQ